MRTRSLAAIATVTAIAASVPTASADQGGTPNGRSTYTFAAIGDVPYGADQIAAFPGWIQQINADPDVRSVVHLGDIKNGSSVCSNEYFSMIRKDFDTFADPFVYTPGDNEWTDCHRQNNGAYNPLERLAKLRSVFFNQPGRTLGQKQMNVYSQASMGLPENVSYRKAGVDFAAINMPGSNDGTQPWTGLGYTEPTAEQMADYRLRTKGAIALLQKTFGEAKKRGDRAVVVMQQADMFDPTYSPTPEDISAFTPYVQALAKEAQQFGKPVYLLDGDSHKYNDDRPLAPGSTWLERYGVQGSVPNLERVTVDGSSNNTDWLKITVNKPGSAKVLSWTRVPYTS
ncbi:metallophosphoesterase [Calidifontibacter sp. DB0510]|uniref:Metallophosphoesterase n=1 Tax=Metallococcus carri TaxID=1656884 RepID=A0A967AZY1_9MICO|nr:metallophosphoesterase family protein [Metallococcus carri]NHN56226.1 metallophosphoesterase [Metallococcus carri]NOP38723.1 metallophosphoesterase [Calidifontibacter sp. DB2511S]